MKGFRTKVFIFERKKACFLEFSCQIINVQSHISEEL